MKKSFLTAAGFILATMILFTACSQGATGDKDELPFTVEDDQYVIALVSDTQFMSANKPEAYYAYTEFVETNAEALNIKYLIHTGDIVKSPYEESEWVVADTAMGKLVSVPYGVLPGNHDTGNSDRKYTDYCTYFGEDRFKDCEWYGGSHEDNRAHYDLLTMGNTDFVVVYLSDEPSKCCVNFANEIFAKYPDRVGVFCTHNYLENDGGRSQMGDYLYENVILPNDNVVLAICGHNDVTICSTEKVSNERTVYQIMSNYQDGETSTDGYGLFLRVDEKDNTIEAITYSPYTGEFTGHVDESITDEFTIPVPWN